MGLLWEQQSGLIYIEAPTAPALRFVISFLYLFSDTLYERAIPINLSPSHAVTIKLLFFNIPSIGHLVAMLLLISLRLAMSKNQRRLTRPRFFEVPYTFLVINWSSLTK